jgi:hypothetical protein
LVVGGTKQLRFQVVMTAAFSTGTPLRVRLADYRAFQTDVGHALKDHPTGEWNPEGVRWLDVSSYGKGGGGYSHLVPLVLVQREGDALKGAAAASLGAAGVAGWGDCLDEEARGWQWTLTDMRVQLYDLGVGVMAGVYDVVTPVGLDKEYVAREILDASRIARNRSGRIERPFGTAYEAVARESVEAFRSAAGECIEGDLPEPWQTTYPAGREGWLMREQRPRPGRGQGRW